MQPRQGQNLLAPHNPMQKNCNGNSFSLPTRAESLRESVHIVNFEKWAPDFPLDPHVQKLGRVTKVP